MNICCCSFKYKILVYKISSVVSYFYILDTYFMVAMLNIYNRMVWEKEHKIYTFIIKYKENIEGVVGHVKRTSHERMIKNPIWSMEITEDLSRHSQYRRCWRNIT